MTKVGIIGKGRLIQNWIETLKPSDLDSIDTLIFYDYYHDNFKNAQNKETKQQTFADDPNYNSICQKIRSNKDLSLEVQLESDFNSFYTNADLILFTASASTNKSPLREGLKQSFEKYLQKQFSQDKISSEVRTALEEKLNLPVMNLEWFIYETHTLGIKQEELFSELDVSFLDGKKDIASLVLNEVIKLKSNGFLRYGTRNISALSESVEIVADYAFKKLRPLIEIGKPLKPIIVTTNEPGICCDVISSVCPELTTSLYGLSSFDTERLDKIIAHNFQEEIKKQGLNHENWREHFNFSVVGDHNSGMIPILYNNPNSHKQSNPDDQKSNQKQFQFFNEVNYFSLYNKLRKLLPYYYFEQSSFARKDTPIKKETNLNVDVNRSLNGLIDLLTRSKNSMHLTTERSDSIFVPAETYPGINIPQDGIFLVHPYRILNGKTDLSKSRIDVIEDNLIIKRELQECVLENSQLMENILNILSQRTKYMPENKNIASPSNQKLYLNPEINNGHQTSLFVAGKHNLNFLKMNPRNYKIVSDENRSPHENEKHRYTSFHHLNDFHNNLALLFAGYSRKIDIFNMKKEKEMNSITLNLEWDRPQNKFDRDLQGINFIGNIEREVFFAHPYLGVFHLGLEEIYQKKGIEINPKNKDRYFIENSSANSLAHAQIASENIIISSDNVLRRYNTTAPEGKVIGLTKDCIIESFTIDQKNNFYLGTNRGEIIVLDSNGTFLETFLSSSDEDHLKIKNLTVAERYLFFNHFRNDYERNIFKAEISPILRSKNSEELNEEQISLEIIPFYRASSFDGQGNNLFLNELDQNKLIIYDHEQKKERGSYEIQRIGFISMITNRG